MNQYGKIEVIDREGWRREYSPPKNIVHIGSDPRNDVVLETGRGAGVAPLHAQLITSTDRPGYQLVNLGDGAILLGLSSDQALPPRSATDIVSGTVFRIGDFTLVFYGEGGGDGGSTSSSQHIGLRVSLPRTWLEPNRSLDGVVTVSNLGDRGGVQVNLELEGLEPECYDIEPGPILASGGEREVSFHLYHRGGKPLAGDRRITIRATAPRVYLAEQATVSQVIRVLPFFRHRLHIVPPGRAVPSRRVPTVEAGPSLATAERAPKTEAAPPSQVDDWWTPSPVVTVGRAPQAEPAAPSRVEVPEPKIRPEAGPPQVEQPTPEAETRPPSPVAVEPMEDERALEVETSPQVEERLAETEAVMPAPIEEERAPEAETVPLSPVEDGWAPVAEAGLEQGTEARQVLKLKAGPPPEEVEQPQEAEASPPPGEDWWSAEAEAVLEGETEARQVLKLKAGPPPEEVEQPQEAEASPPPAEDWWSEAVLEEEKEERQVLKLKAGPLPEEAEQELETGPPSLAEDWWAPQTEGALAQIEEEPNHVEASPPSRTEERAPDTEADTR
jgi:hypothetical protein